MDWWQEFFDATYAQLWSHLHPPDVCEAHARQVVARLSLHRGDRVLDAPCGYGRVSLPLARLGMQVTGVDFSGALLELARQRQEEHPSESVHYVQSDLRSMQLEGEFDAAIHLFSSLGYGEEEDDVQVLSTIYRALRKGASLLLETVHRDAIVHRLRHGLTTGIRGPDGLVMREHNQFDPIAGTLESTWSWNSPTRSGSKHSRMRIYSASELVALLQRVGFDNIDCAVALSAVPFSSEHLGEHLGIRAKKSS